ncbi:Cyclic nucleotide-binding-like [Phytophthora cactorum]|nr:Cyclic nucleotide-binding-like [Phytophthora cactorum]
MLNRTAAQQDSPIATVVLYMYRYHEKYFPGLPMESMMDGDVNKHQPNSRGRLCTSELPGSRALSVESWGSHRDASDPLNGWEHGVMEALHATPCIAIAVLVNLMICVPFGLSFFPLEWQDIPVPHALGIQMFLLSSTICQFTFVWLSNFDGAICQMMVENVPFMHTISVAIIQELGPKNPSVLPTILVTYAFSSVVCGALFYVLGHWKLGNIVYLFPKHIIVGAVGGIGAFVLQSGIENATGRGFDWSWDGVKGLFDEEIVWLWVSSALLALTLWILARHIKSPLFPPLFFVSIPPLFYVLLLSLGISTDTAREHGWFFSRAPNVAFYSLWEQYDFSLVAWHVIPKQFGTIVGLTFFSLMHVPINIPSLSLTTDKEVDINDELVAHGISNAVSGMCGTVQNYLCYSTSALYYKCGGAGRRSGFVIGLIMMFFFFVGPNAVSYIPRCMAGCVMMHLGWDLLREALIDTYDQLDALELGTVWAIAGTMTFWGMNQGLAVGALLACMTFVMQRHLKGHLFFGNINQLSDYVRELFEEGHDTSSSGVESPLQSVLSDDIRPRADIRWLVLDFTLVVGLDSSAADRLTKIKYACDTHNCKIVFAAVPKAYAKFTEHLIELFGDNRMLHIASDLDSALEWCEDDILGKNACKEGSPSSTCAADEDEFTHLRNLRRFMPDQPLSVQQRLLDYFHIQEIDKDEVVWRQGDTSDRALLLVDGALTAVVEEEAGTTEKVSVGSVVGEMCFLTGEKRKTSLIATKPTGGKSIGGHECARAERSSTTELLRTPGFALQLGEFLFSAEASEAQRQLSALLLKKLVTSHWVASEETTYVVPENEKTQVKQALVLALQQRLELFAGSKLQTALCLILTAIFERDWPDQWTEILPAIMAMISGQDKLRIDFAVRFLSLAGAISPATIAASSWPLSSRTYVASSCSRTSSQPAQVGNTTARQLLHENTTQWIALFLEQLATPVHNVKDYSIKIQILTTLASFVREWPKEMTDLMPQIMPQVYGLMLNDAEAFEHQVVLNSSEEEEGYDSDGEGALIGRSAMIVAAFEFVRGAIQAPTKKTRQLIVGGLADFVFAMIGYMQITVSQMEAWQEDPNKYVADEDDESLAFNVRNAATDLLTELEAVLGRKAVVAALDAAQRRLKAENPNNWRLQEAALLVVGCLAGPTLDAISKNAADISQLLDLSAFLQTLFKVMNAGSQEIYLRARALWCASRLAKGMNQEMLDAFLQVAISGLEQGQVLPVRMYACRAIGAIIRHDTGKARLQDAGVVIIDRLTSLAEQSTHETLHIALETLVVVLQESDSVALESAQRVVACFLHRWSQNLNDPLISELIDGAFGALLQLDNAVITAKVHEQVLPVIRSMLVQSAADLGDAGNGIYTAGSALTILKTLLRHSFASSGTLSSGGADPATQQLGAQVVQQTFEPLVTVLGAVEDEKVLNAGSECLKWFVMFAVDPLAAYTTAAGTNGIDTTLSVSAKLLSPAVSDASATCSILSAVCAQLAATELPSLVQSLCMVFARLVHSHGPEILNVLEQLPPPTAPAGQTQAPNMLTFVFRTWIEKQQDFYGLYCIKVTVSALLKVVEWNDPRINAITVTGSAVDSPSADGAGIRTRSKARSTPASDQTQYTAVHFLTKFVVILAKTMSNLAEDEEEWESSDDDSSDGEGDDEDVGAGASSVFAPAENYELLSDRLDADGAVEVRDGEEPEEEFEAYFDPLNEVDLKVSNAVW